MCFIALALCFLLQRFQIFQKIQDVSLPVTDISTCKPCYHVLMMSLEARTCALAVLGNLSDSFMSIHHP